MMLLISLRREAGFQPGQTLVALLTSGHLWQLVNSILLDLHV